MNISKFLILNTLFFVFHGSMCAMEFQQQGLSGVLETKKIFSLHEAVKKGKSNDVKNFIEMGFAVDKTDCEMKTPLDIAQEEKNSEVQNLLQANLDLLKYARSGFLEGVQKALKKEAYVNVKNSEGDTPLHHAAWKGSEEIVQLLLTKGAKAVVNAKNNCGTTPLHLAANAGSERVIKKLFDAGAKDSVNFQNWEGYTPLHSAAFWGMQEALTLLLDAGASVGIENNRREIPLHIAARVSDEGKTFKLLIDAGSDESRGNIDLQTPAEVRKNHLLRFGLIS